MDYVVEFHKHFPDALMKQWQLVWEETVDSHFFNSPLWFIAVLRALKPKEPLLVTVKSKEEYLGFLPLIATRRFGVRVFAFPGGKYLSRAALLIKNGHGGALNLLLSELSKKGNMYLKELDQNLISTVSAGNSNFDFKESSASPYLPLTNGDQFLHLPKRQKVKIQKRYEKFKSRLTFRTYKGEIEGLKPALQIDEFSAKRLRGIAVFEREKDKVFYRELIRVFGKGVAIDVLYFDCDPFVFQISFNYKDKCLLDSTAYKTSYRHLAPGRLLLHFLLERLGNEKCELVDFSRGIDQLKVNYTPYVRKQFSLVKISPFILKLWWRIVETAIARLKANKPVYATGVWVKSAGLSILRRF